VGASARAMRRIRKSECVGAGKGRDQNQKSGVTRGVRQRCRVGGEKDVVLAIRAAKTTIPNLDTVWPILWISVRESRVKATGPAESRRRP